jgi:hypothetical protein
MSFRVLEKFSTSGFRYPSAPDLEGFKNLQGPGVGETVLL